VDDIDVDAIMQDIERRVAVRRANGEYPIGLEEQLEAEFRHVMNGLRRREVDPSHLRGHLDDASLALSAIGAHVPASSRIPGGSLVHGAAARVIARHTGTLAEATRTFGTDIVAALREVAALVDAQRGADERQLNDVLASLVDRLAVLEHLGAAVLDLERRLAAIEGAVPGTA